MFIEPSRADEADYSQIHKVLLGCLPAELMHPCDYEDLHTRLADLIEPEERTCRNTVGKPFAGYRMFSCSECGAYLEVDGDTDANLFAGGERPVPRYCPNCGAKVVQE